MQLRKKILNLDEGLNVYSQLLKDEEAILIPFAISLYVTACRIDELIPEYLADLDRNECQESLGIDFEQITGVDYWTGKLTKLRSDMERLGSVPMKEHGFVVNILDFCPETTTDLCRAIEQKVMQMVEMLKEVERRLAEAPAELYGNFYRSQRALCNARPVKVRFERWKREVAVVTLELLKDKQMLEVVEFLKKKVLRHAPLPSERERCRVDLDTLRSHLPHGYELPEDLPDCYARFMRFVTKDGDTLRINYDCYGQYLHHFYYHLTAPERQALIHLDLMLTLIRKERGQLPETLAGMTAMTKAVEQTMAQGYWWASTAWAVVFRIYQIKGYAGSISQFVREVKEWQSDKNLTYPCTYDAVCKPVRSGKLTGMPDEWTGNGLPAQYAILGNELLKMFQ